MMFQKFLLVMLLGAPGCGHVTGKQSYVDVKQKMVKRFVL